MPVGFTAIISAVGQPADDVTVIDENSVIAGHGVSSLQLLVQHILFAIENVFQDYTMIQH